MNKYLLFFRNKTKTLTPNKQTKGLNWKRHLNNKNEQKQKNL